MESIYLVCRSSEILIPISYTFFGIKANRISKFGSAVILYYNCYSYDSYAQQGEIESK